MRRLSMSPEWVRDIHSGRKTIDARLVADDMADIRVGDLVHYPGARVRIRAIRYYASFGDLVAHEDWRKIAPDVASAQDLLDRLRRGRELSEARNGAVALELEPPGP